MYRRLYDFTYHSFSISNNLYINIAAPVIIYTIIQLITHSAVSDSYKSGTSARSLSGIISLITMQLIYIIFTFGLLFLIKNAIYMLGLFERYSF